MAHSDHSGHVGISAPHLTLSARKGTLKLPAAKIYSKIYGHGVFYIFFQVDLEIKKKKKSHWFHMYEMFEVGSKGERKETSITGINASWSKIKGSQS